MCVCSLIVPNFRLLLPSTPVVQKLWPRLPLILAARRLAVCTVVVVTPVGAPFALANAGTKARRPIASQNAWSARNARRTKRVLNRSAWTRVWGCAGSTRSAK